MAQRKQVKAPVHNVVLAAHGLCAKHHTPLLEGGTYCWDCEGFSGVYDPDAHLTPQQAGQPVVCSNTFPSAGRQLADDVREAFRTFTGDPAMASGIRLALNAHREAGTLTRELLLGALEILTGHQAPVQLPTSTPPTPAAPRHTNRYSGQCDRCGGRVEAEQGERTVEHDNWVTRHFPSCPSNPVPAPAAQPANQAALASVPDGRYALESSGDNDLVFYLVDSKEIAKWGAPSVKMVVGGHPDRWVSRRNVPGILERILHDTYVRPEQHDRDADGPYTIPSGVFAGPEGAALRYADEYTRCSRCNRQLTDRQSRLDGIGPVCINLD